MKKILFTAFVCLCPIFGITQNNSVKGQVVDSLNHPVPLVHVMIFSEDEFVVGTITDFEGSFLIDDLRPGSYLLKIIAMGYIDYIREFIHSGIQTDIGILQLKTSSIALDEVELVGRKKLYETRANSLIINVEQNIASSGGSALDLLANTAGVSVNEQSGGLALNGKGQVTIMVNGKPARMDGQALIGLLESMPATEIKNLEVYRNPPSQHDANGSGGMINILTKSKHNNGQGGSASLITGSGEGEKTGASSNFNYQLGKVGLFGNYSFNRNLSPEVWGLESEFNNSSTNRMVIANSQRNPVTVSHNYTFGLDYNLSKNTVLGASISGYSRKWDMLAEDNVIRNDADNGIETLNLETNEINSWCHISGNFHIEQSLGDSQRLLFDYDHLYYKDDNPSNYQITSQGEPIYVDTQKKTPITFNIFNLGYDTVLSETVDAMFGAKATYSHFTNVIVVSSLIDNEIIIDDQLSSATSMGEKIHAVFASFQFQFGEKTNLTTGIRFEHTNNLLETDEGVNSTTKRNYGNLFPSLAFTQKINDGHQIQVNYSRRINRPTFNQLAPFALFLGPNALYSGNSKLQPAFVNKYGMEWRWYGKSISFEYQTEEDAIVEFQPRISENGEQYIFKAENMDQRKILSGSLGLPLRIAPWWEVESNIIFLYETLRFSFQDVVYNRSQASLRVTGSHQFSFGENTKLEIGGYYQSQTLLGVSTFGGLGALNMGIRRQFRKNHGTLQLSFTNILASENWKIRTNTSEPFVRTFETYFPESRVVSLTYTKRFGGSREKGTYKGNSAEEEKKRIQ